MKRLLAASFFPAFDPPMSGGEQKVLKLYTSLSRYFHIDLVSFTYPTRSERIRHTATFTEHRIAKGPDWDHLWAAAAAQGHAGELSGVTAQLVARGLSPFHEEMRRHWDAADAVIYDFPYVYPFDPCPQDHAKTRIYNSHNFEAALTRSIVTGGDGALHDMVERAEEALCRSSALILATSEIEAQAFSLFYQVPRSRIRTLPLGFDPADVAAPPEAGADAGAGVGAGTGAGTGAGDAVIPDTPFCFFIGSQHGPNVQAAGEVVALARRMPDVAFVIAGAVCAALDEVPDNVTVAGRVDEATKQALFCRAAVFLNPMREGAGMNVKLVEALGAGLNVVSTAVGARGFAPGQDPIVPAETPEAMETALREALLETGSPADRAARRARAEDSYSWDRLADRCADWIDSACEAPVEENDEGLASLSLFVNDFPVGDGAAGGQKRMLDLIASTPLDDPKVLLTMTESASIQITLRAPDFIEINIPKSAGQRRFERKINQWNVMSVADIAASMFVTENTLFMRWFRRLVRRASNLVFEHCYMAPLIEALPEGARPQLIYSAHNVEAELKDRMLAFYSHTHRSQMAEAVERIERLCAQSADQVLAVTAQDADRLEARYGLPVRPTVVVNGTRVPEGGDAVAAERVPPGADARLDVIFIGSAHPPNVSAMRDFIDQVLPLLGTARLTVVGEVCTALHDLAGTDGLRLKGRVSEDEKQQLLGAAHVAVNPMTLGGGSSLKIGDYLCAGLPTVTTETGVRGFDLSDGQDVLMADMGAPFADAINRLHTDPEVYARLSAGGAAYARAHLDWRRLGRQVADLCAPPRPAAAVPAVPSVLAITYRYTEPRRGGAEEYLFKTLTEMHRQGAMIDVVALDLQQINNTHGMVCAADGLASAAPAYAPFARSLRYFPLDPRKKMNAANLAAGLARQVVGETRDLARNCRDLAPGTLLMGGWHHGEQTPQGFARWTSDCAEILVDQPVRALRIRCNAPGIRTLEISVDDGPAMAEPLNEQNDLTRDLVAGAGSVIRLAVPDAGTVGGDIRQLGVYVRDLHLFDGTEWHPVPLNRALPEYVAETQLDRFMAEMSALAQARDPALNDAFLHARGLRSRAALDHIARIAAGYDHVLVQGIQFAFVHDVSDLLHRIGKPFTLLPHMHLDDTFYHWAPMYDCVGWAGTVLCPENSFYNAFLGGFNPNIVNVAHGGLDPEEFLLPRHSVAQIQRRHGLAGKAYVLVLGRKDSAKQYRKVMEAFGRAGLDRRAELIIVGPDEDQLPVQQAGVRYLGPLPRQDVIALLLGCQTLVSMSQSESFGIVIAEAWASGKPVIANRGCAVFRELVDDGEDGFLVGDTAELATRLDSLLDDAALRDRLGAAGREKALKRFLWSQVAERIRTHLA